MSQPHPCVPPPKDPHGSDWRILGILIGGVLLGAAILLGFGAAVVYFIRQCGLWAKGGIVMRGGVAFKYLLSSRREHRENLNAQRRLRWMMGQDPEPAPTAMRSLSPVDRLLMYGLAALGFAALFGIIFMTGCALTPRGPHCGPVRRRDRDGAFCAECVDESQAKYAHCSSGAFSLAPTGGITH